MTSSCSGSYYRSNESFDGFDDFEFDDSDDDCDDVINELLGVRVLLEFE